MLRRVALADASVVFRWLVGVTVRVQREMKQPDTSRERVLLRIRTPMCFVTVRHVRRSGGGGLLRDAGGRHFESCLWWSLLLCAGGVDVCRRA